MILDIQELIATAQMYRNLVLEGPPGTGKTLLVSQMADSWKEVTGRHLGGSADGDWAMAFHANTGYEDFVEGIRPLEDGFDVRDGFLRICANIAKQEPGKDFLVLLDEFNRANVAKVLGDSLLLLEANKRMTFDGNGWAGGTTITLPYSLKTFALPDNLYFVATMNTSDTSIASLDSALRRRFAFIRIQPMGLDELQAKVTGLHGEEIANEVLATSSIWSLINHQVLQPLFGADSLLGHSYIFGLATELDNATTPRPVASVIDPFPAIVEAVTGRGLKVSSAFWLETNNLTGGSKNQIDLSKSGQDDLAQGSIHYFIPSLTSAELSPSEEYTHHIDIDYNGKTYRNCEVKYYGGPDANHSWRVNLNGTTDDNERLSVSSAKKEFANCLLVFLQTGPKEYTLATAPKESLSAFESRSSFDAIKNSGRKYGKILESRIAGNEEVLSSRNSSDSVRILWRYGILPQLLNTVTGLGAESVLDPTSRRDFIMGYTDLSMELRENALTSLDALDEFLASLQLRLQLDGSGLSRSLIVAAAHPRKPEPVEQHLGDVGDASADFFEAPDSSETRG